MTFALGALFLQAATLGLPAEPASLFWAGVLLVLGLLGSLVRWFAKRLIGSWDAFRREIRIALHGLSEGSATTARDIQAIRQELFGIHGNNGLKSEIREHKRDQRRINKTLQRHSQILVLLADRAEIDVPTAPELEEEDDDDRV